MIVNGENRWANFGNSVKVKQVVYGYKKILTLLVGFPQASRIGGLLSQ